MALRQTGSRWAYYYMKCILDEYVYTVKLLLYNYTN